MACQNTKGRDVRPVQCGSNKPSTWRRSAYALQDVSRGWSGSAPPGNANCIHQWYRSVGWPERSTPRLAFSNASAGLRSKSPVAGNLFPWVRSRLRHALTHGYCRKSLRDSVIHPYLNRIARAVRPLRTDINLLYYNAFICLPKFKDGQRKVNNIISRQVAQNILPPEIIFCRPSGLS